jgi:hypothetical protein
MKHPATTLEAAWSNCSPQPLSGEDLTDLWVDTEAAWGFQGFWFTGIDEGVSPDFRHCRELVGVLIPGRDSVSCAGVGFIADP